MYVAGCSSIPGPYSLWGYLAGGLTEGLSAYLLSGAVLGAHSGWSARVRPVPEWAKTGGTPQVLSPWPEHQAAPPGPLTRPPTGLPGRSP